METDAVDTAQAETDPAAAADLDRAPEPENDDATDEPETSPSAVAPVTPVFQRRTSAKGPYVAYVPASYTGTSPMRVIVGLHGCGDDAYNFATWAVNPSSTRATQTHIGISVGGETGANKCWRMGVDDDKIEAAIQDLGQKYWLDWKRIVIAGYSSGGQLAYRLGMTKGWRYAGIAIENSALYAAGTDSATLLRSASWKLPTIHRAHLGDGVFPISRVKEDWQRMWSAGFPLTTSQLAGDHSGTGADWSEWLIPMSESFRMP